MRPTEIVEIQMLKPGNDFDGRDGEWVTVETVSAIIKPAAGREVVIAGVQIEPLHDYDIMIRYRPWVTTEHRLIGLDNQIYNIRSKSSERRRARWLKLACTEAGTLERERSYSISTVSDFVSAVITSVPVDEDGTTFIVDEDGTTVVSLEA